MPVIDGFIRQYGCPYLFGYCRAAYGSILVATGRWADAERELLAVLRVTREEYPALHDAALARLADLRLRQGRFEEAEELLAGVDSGVTALPTAAALLARGAHAAAAALLERRLAVGSNQVEASYTLELLVDAHVAQGDLDAAALNAQRLMELAAATERDHVRARAAHAAGRVSDARGHLDAAVRSLEEAAEQFSRLQLPHEAARSRLELARSLARTQPPNAVSEARRALVALERLGAEADAAAAGALLPTQVLDLSGAGVLPAGGGDAAPLGAARI